MTTLQEQLESLSVIQRTAATWDRGALLLLAGPGAGKTRVLTTRLAKLIHESPGKNFRVLALTFTTAAAREMRDRVEAMLSGEAGNRLFIGTFHSFGTHTLRQHGSHVGVRSDFGIYDRDEDRRALLVDGLTREGFAKDDARWLPVIDRLKARLIEPGIAASRFRDPAEGKEIARVYQVYERALRAQNVLDFNGLILETCRLARDMPAVAQRIRSTYRYWMVDEFQDTSPAQYRMLRVLAGQKFADIFCVADDDQIIYQWAGASYRQLEMFRSDFKPNLLQLVENHRCPPEIVQAGNKLVIHNTQRTPEKVPLQSMRPWLESSITLREFETEEEERTAICEEIASSSKDAWHGTAILGRTRSLLEPFLKELQKRGVKAALAQRRDQFISPQFSWLQASLELAIRPTDRQTFLLLVNSANRIAAIELDPLSLLAEAEAEGRSYLEHWALAISTEGSQIGAQLSALTRPLVESRSAWRAFVREAIVLLSATGGDTVDGVPSDVIDDKAAWEKCQREMRAELGADPDLADFVQGLALRSKEPPADPQAVSLLTVHASKGLEFDFVYLVGAAETVMPSWQSTKKGDTSVEMEEERRNCFVAITRTRQRLTISRAKSYRGWSKPASRFLREMELA